MGTRLNQLQNKLEAENIQFHPNRLVWSTTLFTTVGTINPGLQYQRDNRNGMNKCEGACDTTVQTPPVIRSTTGSPSSHPINDPNHPHQISLQQRGILDLKRPLLVLCDPQHAHVDMHSQLPLVHQTFIPVPLTDSGAVVQSGM